MKANLSWNQGMEFECQNRGLKSKIDSLVEFGGKDLAPTPKELLMNAMMGCTAMDVVSMLKKMRQELTSFNMEISVEKTTEHPIHFKTAELIYKLKGPIEREKAIKAVESSLTKYCGVNYIVSKTCSISYQLFLNDELVQSGKTNFAD